MKDSLADNAPHDASVSFSDLKWVIESPSLIVGDNVVHEALLPFPLEKVNEVALNNFLEQQKSHRVGYYFESLVDFYLSKICQFEMVTRRQQIHEENRTIGELDFLFRDHEGKLCHWEVAVKFYLFHPEETVHDSHFIGPNAADTFERKMDRLFGHQLTLSKRYVPDVQQRRAFVKGAIFYHSSCSVLRQLPPLLSPSHQRGLWIHASELPLLDQQDFSSAKILQKPYWLTSHSNDYPTAVLTRQQLLDHLHQHFQSSDETNLVSLQVESVPPEFRTTHLFVVSDDWPHSQKTD